MGQGRYPAYFVGGAVALWYVAVLIWAFQPLTETMRVGIDYTATPPKALSVTVECNSLFSSSVRSEDPPVLTPQPEGQPELGYPREPCEFVHADARRAFVIDTVVVVLAAIGLLGYRWRRRRRGDVHDPPVRSPGGALVG